MRTYALRFCTIAIVAVAGAPLSADRVKLRSGQTVDGSFMSADVTMIRVLLANGQIAQFRLEDVSALEFSPRKAPPPPAPDPSRPPAPVTVPMGTVLNVRLTQAIDADATQAGMTFKGLLDDPVMMGGKVVIPRHAAMVLQVAHVEQAGNFKGSDKITLKANSLAFGGKKYDIVTTYVESKGQGEGKKTARRVGGGAGLGAAIGALAGAGAGAIASAVDTDHLKLPAETRLQFSLNAAVTVQP